MTDKKEQQMKQQISAYLRKKDYYDILGIQKSASESEIKKAYRGLVLKFHPDKNKVQGSKNVFEKVSKSYDTLIDPEKRNRYDRFGPEEDRPQPQAHHFHHHADQEEYFTFQDIFFGRAPRQGHFRGQFRQGPRPQNHHQHQQQGGFNIIFIFLIFFVVYTILPLFQNNPNFSLSPTYEHRIRRTTSKLNTQYFVNQKFMEEARNRQYLRKAEMTMDKEHLVQVQQKCEYMKNQKRNLQTYAYQYSEGRMRQNYLHRAKNVDMTTCRYLHQVSTNYEDYVRELTYMKF